MLVIMGLWIWRQNNTRGSFKKPAKEIIVEADNYEKAEQIFLSIDGCYYDPLYQRDCDCCGQRWYEGYEITEAEAQENISLNNDKRWTVFDASIPRLIVIKKDGTKNIYNEREDDIVKEGIRRRINEALHQKI